MMVTTSTPLAAPLGRGLIPALLLVFCASLHAGPSAQDPAADGRRRAPIFGVFVGSTPCDESIRPLLGIPRQADGELIEWELTLYRPSAAGAPADYRLHVNYGLTTPGRPGLGVPATALERRGSWRLVKGFNGNPAAAVYELSGAVALLRVSDGILHVLNADGTLMVGNGGWSYTLNRRDRAEAAVDPSLSLQSAGPDGPRTVSPLAAGPQVFGVFEGRSPCQGIARELNIPVNAACAKVKWRITLHHDLGSREPTTYMIESTLHRSGAREGRWSVLRRIGKAPGGIVYRLAPAGDEAALFLSSGDDNVLFFVDQRRRPLIGHAGFSYTLNRRPPLVQTASGFVEEHSLACRVRSPC